MLFVIKPPFVSSSGYQASPLNMTAVPCGTAPDTVIIGWIIGFSGLANSIGVMSVGGDTTGTTAGTEIVWSGSNNKARFFFWRGTGPGTVNISFPWTGDISGAHAGCLVYSGVTDVVNINPVIGGSGTTTLSRAVTSAVGQTAVGIWVHQETANTATAAVTLRSDETAGAFRSVAFEEPGASIVDVNGSTSAVVYPVVGWGFSLVPNAADTTPPVITGPTGAAGAADVAVSIAENTTACGTWSANETVTWSLNGGADAALFSINSSTGALSFLTARDFENPQDADLNNTYVVVVRASDAASPANISNQTVTVTITNAGFSLGSNVSNMNATVGVAFSQGVSGNFVGTDTPYSYALQSGTLPAGLTLNTSTGVISGTPTTAGTATGIIIRATDSGGTGVNSNSFNITVSQPLATTLSFTLVSASNVARADLTAQKGAVFSQATPDLWTAPILKFANETTNPAGLMLIDITGLGVRVGDICGVVLTNSNGDPAQSPTPLGAFFLVAAS